MDSNEICIDESSLYKQYSGIIFIIIIIKYLIN